MADPSVRIVAFVFLLVSALVVLACELYLTRRRARAYRRRVGEEIRKIMGSSAACASCGEWIVGPPNVDDRGAFYCSPACEKIGRALAQSRPRPARMGVR